uniref:Uncharacterized protein n=1 Tax=Anopheles albimanus TaxID=7167 RepID=A0A182FZ12_ANOAL
MAGRRNFKLRFLRVHPQSNDRYSMIGEQDGHVG